MNKVISSAKNAVADIANGSSIAVGGFGMCGVPTVLIDALTESGVDDLTVVSNNCGTDAFGLGILLREHRISRVVASYVGENEEFARQYLTGEIELELTPQGSLAERLRAGGCGIPAFFTLAGVGTLVGDGGLPLRYSADGNVLKASMAKEQRTFSERTYLLEKSITTDFAFVRARVADEMGNAIFHASARNFNPLCAMAARTTIVEAEQIVPPGELDPDLIHLPGIFVQRVVAVPEGTEKPIEKLTLTRSAKDIRS
ncbi:MAG TPA: CoA transferase subunit A [Acidimicrobiales bacterium]|nr:CoA transferase subunit A [Acidimicrobiales bacterium]